MKKKFFFFVFVVLVAAVIINSNAKKDGAPDHASTTATALKGLQLPASQQALMDLLTAHETAYFDTTKHAEREALGQAQDAELCDMIGHAAKDWVGMITSVSTEADAKGSVEIKLSDTLTIMTWGNSVSDGNDGSLIAPGSAVYTALQGLKLGDAVRFSGRIAKDRNRCYRYANLSSRGRKKSPQLIFLFDTIEPI